MYLGIRTILLNIATIPKVHGGELWPEVLPPASGWASERALEAQRARHIPLNSRNLPEKHVRDRLLQ